MLLVVLATWLDLGVIIFCFLALQVETVIGLPDNHSWGFLVVQDGKHLIKVRICIGVFLDSLSLFVAWIVVTLWSIPKYSHHLLLDFFLLVGLLNFFILECFVVEWAACHRLAAVLVKTRPSHLVCMLVNHPLDCFQIWMEIGRSLRRWAVISWRFSCIEVVIWKYASFGDVEWAAILVSGFSLIKR